MNSPFFIVPSPVNNMPVQPISGISNQFANQRYAVHQVNGNMNATTVLTPIPSPYPQQMSIGLPPHMPPPTNGSFEQAMGIDPAAQMKSDLFKTEMCHNYMEKGFCKYGSRCAFAHGVEELRPKPRDTASPVNVDKGVLCHSYHNDGYCPYGERCKFTHEVPTPSPNLRYVQKYRELPDGTKEIVEERVVNCETCPRA